MYVRVTPPTEMAWVDAPTAIAVAAAGGALAVAAWCGFALHPVSAITSARTPDVATASVPYRVLYCQGIRMSEI
jgi:hypothetical protein